MMECWNSMLAKNILTFLTLFRHPLILDLYFWILNFDIHLTFEF